MSDSTRFLSNVARTASNVALRLERLFQRSLIRFFGFSTSSCDHVLYFPTCIVMKFESMREIPCSLKINPTSRSICCWARDGAVRSVGRCPSERLKGNHTINTRDSESKKYV
jgi:hypothetical protein